MSSASALAKPEETTAALATSLPQMGPSASGRRWRLREADTGVAAAIAEAAGVEPLLARVLAARGVTADNAQDYLEPTLRKSLPDPYILTDMECGARRIADAVIAGEKIGVFGDYDVDGTSASAILRLYFDRLGAASEIYLPDRMAEGYGPSIEAFHSLKDAGAQVTDIQRMTLEEIFLASVNQHRGAAS